MCYSGRRPGQRTLHEFLTDRFFVPELPWSDDEDITAFTYPLLPIVRNEEPDRVGHAQWGFIPTWVRDTATAEKMAGNCRNARAETLFEKPAYRDAVIHQRCLVFFNGFYEWQHQGKRKLKHYIRRRDTPMLCMGGLWSIWSSSGAAEQIATCVIITTDANPLMATIHNTKKRQPLILPEKQWASWLNHDLDQEAVQALCAVYGDADLEATPLAEPDAQGQAVLF